MRVFSCCIQKGNTRLNLEMRLNNGDRIPLIGSYIQPIHFLTDQRNKKFVHKGKEETFRLMAYKTLNIALEELISSTTITKSNAFNSKDFLEIAICFGERSLKPAGKKQLSNPQ